MNKKIIKKKEYIIVKKIIIGIIGILGLGGAVAAITAIVRRSNGC